MISHPTILASAAIILGLLTESHASTVSCDTYLDSVAAQDRALFNTLLGYSQSRTDYVPDMSCKLSQMALFASVFAAESKPKTSSWILGLVREEVTRISSRMDKFNSWRFLNFRLNPLIRFLSIVPADATDNVLVQMLQSLDDLDYDAKEMFEKNMSGCQDIVCLQNLLQRVALIAV